MLRCYYTQIRNYMDLNDVTDAAKKLVNDSSEVVKKTAHELFEERIFMLAVGIAVGIGAGYALFNMSA